MPTSLAPFVTDNEFGRFQDIRPRYFHRCIWLTKIPANKAGDNDKTQPKYHILICGAKGL